MTRRSLLGALLLAALPTPPTSAAGGASVRLTFSATAQVRGSIIRLSEVAQIECSDPKLTEALRMLDVGSAPLFGSSRTLSIAYARVRIKSLGIRDEQISVSGPEQVAITRLFQTVSSDTLLQAALDAVEPHAKGAALQPSTRPQELRIAPGDLTLRPREPQLSSTSAHVTLEVCVEGKVETTVTVNLRLLPRVRALVAARALPAGTILTEADIQQGDVAQSNGSPLLLDISQAIGRQLSAALPEGSPLLPQQLRLVPLVKRGDRVKVTCRSGSVAISCAAEAQQDGTMGQTIRVRNVLSQQDFTARVVGSSELEMTF